MVAGCSSAGSGQLLSRSSIIIQRWHHPTSRASTKRGVQRMADPDIAIGKPLRDALWAWAGTYSLESRTHLLQERASDQDCPDAHPNIWALVEEQAGEHAHPTLAPEAGPVIPRAPSTAQTTNSLTGDTYIKVDSLNYTCDMGGEQITKTKVPILHCEVTGIVVIALPTGVVQSREKVLLDAATFAADFERHLPLLASPATTSVVLCGHSEGGAVAEALALALLGQYKPADTARSGASPFTSVRKKLLTLFGKRKPADIVSDSTAALACVCKKLYLVTSGAHLWMHAHEASTLEDWLCGRSLGLVGAHAVSDTCASFDGFCIKHNEEDPASLVSAKRRMWLILSQDGRVVTSSWSQQMTASTAAITVAGMSCSVNHAYFGQLIHQWSEYENRVRTVFATCAFSDGAAVP